MNIATLHEYFSARNRHRSLSSCADELEALIVGQDGASSPQDQRISDWFGWHLGRGQTITERPEYRECSCGATLWHAHSLERRR